MNLKKILEIGVRNHLILTTAKELDPDCGLTDEIKWMSEYTERQQEAIRQAVINLKNEGKIT